MAGITGATGDIVGMITMAVDMTVTVMVIADMTVAIGKHKKAQEKNRRQPVFSWSVRERSVFIFLP